MAHPRSPHIFCLLCHSLSLHGALRKFSKDVAMDLKFALTNSKGISARSIVLAEWFLVRVMLVCLGFSIANVSPLLHEVFGKLIAF